MTKKLSFLLVTAALLAVTVPASASAAPAITDGSGNLLKVGTKLTASNGATNFVVKTSLGDITCTFASFPWEIVQNDGSHVAGTGTGAGSLTICKFKGLSVTGTDFTMSGLLSTEAKKGVINLTFEFDLPGLTCHYSGGAMPFTYSSGGNSIFINAFLTASPAACGTASIFQTFFLKQSGGGSVVLD